MDIRHELSLPDKCFKWFALEDTVITVQQVEHGGFQYHVAGIDRCPVLGVLLAESFHRPSDDVKHAFLLSHLDGGECGSLTVALVEFDKLVDIDIAHCITIRHHESLISHIRLNTLDASPRHGVITSVYDGDFPCFKLTMMYRHFVLPVSEVKAYVAVVQEIVGKPLLDVFLLISGTDNKLIVSIVGILFHNMP